jgi:hypothetical protein
VKSNWDSFALRVGMYKLADRLRLRGIPVLDDSHKRMRVREKKRRVCFIHPIINPRFP